MDHSSKHQGELSLLEMIQNLQSPNGRKTPDSSLSSASLNIALNEEKHRRQECEKVIQQLQSQISAMQQDYAVAEATIQRKDSLLMQAQQQWKTIEMDWKQRIALAEEEKERLVSTVARLEGQIQISSSEARKTSAELHTVCRKNEEKIRDLQEENKTLKDNYEYNQSQLRQITAQLQDSQKEVKRCQSQLDETERENRRLKSQIEDLKREKNKSTVALELLQERYDSSCEQWESHCELRVKEATKKAEEESEQRLKMWQNEVESKLRQLVTTLEQQLGILKTKSLEEAQSMESRHQAEISKMTAQCSSLLQQVQRQKKEYDDLTRQMRELVEAQWNTVNRIQPSSGAGRPASPAVASEISATTSVTSDSLSSNTRMRRDEIHQYVSQIMQRHSASSSTNKVPNDLRESSNPAKIKGRKKT